MKKIILFLLTIPFSLYSSNNQVTLKNAHQHSLDYTKKILKEVTYVFKNWKTSIPQDKKNTIFTYFGLQPTNELFTGELLIKRIACNYHKHLTKMYSREEENDFITMIMSNVAFNFLKLLKEDPRDNFIEQLHIKITMNRIVSRGAPIAGQEFTKITIKQQDRYSLKKMANIGTNTSTYFYNFYPFNKDKKGKPSSLIELSQNKKISLEDTYRWIILNRILESLYFDRADLNSLNYHQDESMLNIHNKPAPLEVVEGVRQLIEQLGTHNKAKPINQLINQDKKIFLLYAMLNDPNSLFGKLSYEMAIEIFSYLNSDLELFLQGETKWTIEELTAILNENILHLTSLPKEKTKSKKHSLKNKKSY